MKMLDGAQNSSFLSATSFMWASTITLVIVGIVFLIKFRERHDYIKKTRFIIPYTLILVLNILEFFMIPIMENEPFYALYIYKLYIFLKFFCNLSIIAYVFDYLNFNNNIKKTIEIIEIILIIAALICCIFLDIRVQLEVRGKFEVLVGPLNNIYNIYAISANAILLIFIVVFRKRLPKAFVPLSIVTFLIYVLLFMFKNLTGYSVKESVFIYSLLVLIIFNTTSNQDKVFVSKLADRKNALMNINNRRKKIIDIVNGNIRQTLNNIILYNDELYLTKEHNRKQLQKDSKEVNKNAYMLKEYLTDVNDIFLIESNNMPINNQYKLDTLIKNVYSKILPIIKNKKIKFNVVIDKNSYLNYIGDNNKIEKIIINIIENAIENIGNDKTITLYIRSKQSSHKNIALDVAIKSSGVLSNIEMAKLDINEFIDSPNSSSMSNLKMVISNELLGLLNSKINIKVNKNSTIYSFMIIQTYKDNVLYSSIN